VTSLDAWVCPKCGRLVPRAMDVCRCGHQATGAEERGIIAPPAQAPVAQAPEPRSSWTPWAGLGILVVLGLSAVLLKAPSGPVPAGESRSPAAQPQQAVASAPAAHPAVPAPNWPSDPTLWRQPDAALPAPSSTLVAAPQARSAQSLEDVVSAAIPGVVLVETTDARGTGFFVAGDTVVTNAHVVEGATYVTLRLSSGADVPAVVQSRSTDMDLATLHVVKAPAGQVVLPLASSSEVRVGQEVVAIGSPLGLQNTVTRGIVSGLRRLGAVTLVQTDAAINPGNSGGPLLDRTGRVIAVATMKLSGQAEALGFGVAGEHVRALLDGAASATSGGQRPVDLMNGGGGDDDRQAATGGYERFMAEASRRAAPLDRSWSEIVNQCLGGAAPATRGERGWFAVWERFDDSKVSPACSQYFADFKRMTSAFHDRMVEAADQARRAGVYPGDCRDIRHRYSLDSPDW
jgi:S1-C subfamily serine protease